MYIWWAFHVFICSIIDCLRLFLVKYILSPFLIYIKSAIQQRNSLSTVITDIFRKHWNAQNLGHMQQWFNSTVQHYSQGTKWVKFARHMQMPRLEFNLIRIFWFFLIMPKGGKKHFKGEKKRKNILYNYHKCLELQCEFLFKRKHE